MPERSLAEIFLANGGRQIKPSIIDRVQDRYGKTIYKQDSRICEGCNSTRWIEQDEPDLIDTRDQILDPMTAYQMVNIMEGVLGNDSGMIGAAVRFC